MAIKTEHIHRADLHGYLAQSDGDVHGGVLILPTIFAVNQFAVGFADALAHAGLAAAVWDPYSGLPLATEYEECRKRSRTLTDGGAAAMMSNWLEFMLSDLRLNSLGTVGFCLGGRFALLLAAQEKRIKACAAVYPTIEQPRLSNQEQDALSLAEAVHCPVHLVQPGHDHVTSAETYLRLKEALRRRSAPTIVQFHPDAEHGFMHRKEPAANRIATAVAAPQVIAFVKACLN
jgi:carboxymethylenebutenolidase